MAYRYDSDLEFLKQCNNEELKSLYDVLIYDKDGEKRISETLTISKECEIYKEDYRKYWQRIAEEYQYFGGNSFANFVRGSGVKYDEILQDVMKDLKILYNKDDSIEKREEKLILKIFDDMLKNLSEVEKMEMIKNVGIKTTSFNNQAIIVAVQTLFRYGGFKSYQISVIIANYISRIFLGRGLTFAANATLTKTLSIFVGPIGWGVAGAWTAIDIAGPAKRVIIPATIIIACLRKQVKMRTEKDETEIKKVEVKEEEEFVTISVLDIEKCYKILNLNKDSSIEELEKKYKENIKRFENLDEEEFEHEKLFELMRERKKEIEESYIILKDYFQNKENFDYLKCIALCPKCNKKIKFSKSEGKKRCPICKTVVYVKNI